ncbi:hypothetical protein AAEP93_005095 [Penicillium crustosum]
MAVLPDRRSMEMGPPTPQPTDEVRAAPETSLTSHYGASRRAATSRFVGIRTPVIPPGYQQIPGYEAHRQRQEARALMGSIAERRGKPTPAPILIFGDALSLLPRRRRWDSTSTIIVSQTRWVAPTTPAREMFHGFEDDITADCDDIDKISQSAWVRQLNAELQTPEGRQIILTYIDATGMRREYEDKLAAIDARLQSC